jgi:stress response protein YsnF
LNAEIAMTRTITAYFDDVQTAERAAHDLARQVPGVRGEVFDSRSDSSSLSRLALPEDDAATLSEGFRRGGGVVHAEVPDGRFEEVAATLETAGAVDLDDREATWRKEGWTGATAPLATAPGSTAGTATMGATGGTARAAGDAGVQRLGEATDEASIPIIEERLRVGKREAGHGRVRIRSYVVETPVQEQVTLRQEHVEIQRRPVDRPVTGAEAAFGERVVEATERREEAVIAKEARVKEEVSLRKTAEDRTETVRDTVRHTEVEVDDDRKAGTAATPTTAAPATKAPATKDRARDI